jgi:Ferritin-like domain
MARIVIADGAAETAHVAAFERERRELLRRGFALGGAAIAASSIPLLLSVRTAFAETESDGAILQGLIDLERVAVVAYDRAIDSGLLSPAMLRRARRFREHERQHADALTTALTDLGGASPEPAKRSGEADKVVTGLADADSQADVVNFAIELETAAVAAYHDAHAKLVEAKLLQTGVSIMANEGQHLAVLRAALGEDAVPNAFETGAE